ncbi:TPA: hypothetical protein ACF2DD_000129 [Clostridium perfringens]|uniref:hypothetical protein n=1 Tax=Clostridium perfringens TaxID=1502 RepID=UPI00096A3147|nr:hypothetical protein [Clostridium perfringens]MCR1963982.1 hypothetical protein [Clostridium perfringens]MDM0582646.1 hypothetical protein [Clostridium perfringens]QPR51400.1 hypothetical protein I6G88_15130 [Clostridium perfringens]
MQLDKFLNNFLENIIDDEYSNKVIKLIKEGMEENNLDFNSAKVECQVLTENNNYDPRVEISSEAYNDGEIIFLDYHVDNLDK